MVAPVLALEPGSALGLAFKSLMNVNDVET